MKLKAYIDASGRSAFEAWFQGLDARAAARITVSLTRLEQGNFSNVEPVGGGVSECKIDFGPGYRIYFGKDGLELVILLCGGTKTRQQYDIETAKTLWTDYKTRKKGKA